MGGGMGGMGNIPGAAFGGVTDPSMVQVTEGFRVIPAISAGQRYDSNVFFVPKTPGLNPEDYVTTVAPQIRGLYAGSLFTVNATALAFSEYYARNTSLSYVGTNAGAALDLSKLLDRWRQGTTWTVTDNFRYTPQPPAFLTGDLNGGQAHPLLAGYQAGRVNSQSNTIMTNLAVPLTQSISLIGNYSNGFIKFGNAQVQQVGALFNVNTQTYYGGLAMKLSPLDTVNLNFVGSEFNYDSGTGSFSSRGGTLGWSHMYTPNVRMYSAAGFQIINGQFQGAAPISSAVVPTGNIGLTWTDTTTQMLLAYSVSNTPTFQFQGGVLLSQVVTFTVTQVTPISGLIGILGVNYGRGDQFAGNSSNPVSYLSYGGIAGMTYMFTPKTFLGLTYSYANYDNKFGGASFAFDRSVVQFTLSQAFY